MIWISLDKVNGLLLRMICISSNTVWSSLYVTVFFPKIFFKQRFTLTYSSYIPPDQVEVGGLKFHIIFLELTYCCISSAVKFEPLSCWWCSSSTNNRVNPLMHTDALHEGTNYKHIPRVEEHVNENIQALYISLPFYSNFMCNGPSIINRCRSKGWFTGYFRVW